MYRVVLTNLTTGHKLQRLFIRMGEGERAAHAALIQLGCDQDGCNADGDVVWQVKIHWQQN